MNMLTCANNNFLFLSCGKENLTEEGGREVKTREERGREGGREGVDVGREERGGKGSLGCICQI